MCVHLESSLNISLVVKLSLKESFIVFEEQTSNYYNPLKFQKYKKKL